MKPFLVGGPAYCGTTLLAMMLTRPGVVCLDEPDFEKPAQAHRGIPVLRALFPGADLPVIEERPLGYREAFGVMMQCAAAVRPTVLGFKTCNWDFVSFARLFRALDLPVGLIVRDLRDALVGPLRPGLDEEGMNSRFRLVWQNRALASLVIRYEDLVADPRMVMAELVAALGQTVEASCSWDPRSVPRLMLKSDRHQTLLSGQVSASKVGIWKTSGRAWSPKTVETAHMMGYPD